MLSRRGHRNLRMLCAAVISGALALYTLAREDMSLPERSEVILENAAAREGWLNLCGWAVTAVSETHTQIPTEWNTEIGQRWLMLQGQQGFSPERYAGEAATRYCYHIENITAEGFTADAWYAELLLCGDVLVGAQVYCAASPNSMQSVR